MKKTPEICIAVDKSPFSKKEDSDTASGTINKFLQLDSQSGRLESGTKLDNMVTIIDFQQSNRISVTTEAHKSRYKPVELAPNLDTNFIPKWDTLMEMGRLVDDINAGLAEGKSIVDAVGKSAQELEMNIRSYNSEIIKSKAVLPHLNRFAQVESVTRIVGNNGRLFVDAISAKERKGAVLEASRVIEDSLIAAENNSFAVLMSPDGWHGFTDKNGREVSPHLNTQVLVFWKDPNGRLKGLTFHIDLEYDKAREVMLSLGVSQEALEGKTEKDRLVNMVKNPALLSLPQAYSNVFEYVLDKILAARGNRDFRLLQQDGSVEIRPVADVRRDIARFDQLLLGSRKEEEHIAGLINYNLSKASNIQDRSIQQQIIYKIEKTILFLTRVYLKESGKLPVLQQDDNFALERAYLKTRAGCPPGGTFSLRGISLGSSILSESTTSFPGGITGEYHVGTCGNCGSSNVLVGDCGICTGCEKDMAA
ncbi:hypothetical protein A3H40_00310 [Candidatus Daviesbacteria bacterium RIFCSPLOWO2_02_FULL_38_15]|uniref:Uncharacterized protein n=1 Tax=Candidatus Daviesbacteria bacterium RIFCSPLOWO2_02_FULL_38_15 TaxID=1797794 RepID=A0A1F5N517_9BACT|nr:MAG: hypothetical protein A3H40_00310 [Candidatus Daviesbacteria bacterium RIFCSPLOWO2_02_FULL_38_15]